MKHVLKVENAEVEFESQEDLERYFKGERPELEKVNDNYYKASFKLKSNSDFPNSNN